MGSVIKRYKMPIICLTPSSWTVGVCVLFYFYGSREALQEGEGGKEREGRERPEGWEMEEPPSCSGHHELKGPPDPRGGMEMAAVQGQDRVLRGEGPELPLLLPPSASPELLFPPYLCLAPCEEALQGGLQRVLRMLCGNSLIPAQFFTNLYNSDCLLAS